MKPALATALALSLAAAPALAATRSIVLPPASIAAGLKAVQLGYAVTLDHAADSYFLVPFVIPADYQAGTVLKLRVNFTAANACTMVLAADAVFRNRIGKATHESIEGVSPAGPVAVQSPGMSVTFRKTFEIKGPKTANFQGVKPGDTYLVRIKRAKTAPEDTCESILIHSAEVRYRAEG